MRPASWYDDNQRFLLAELDRVASRFDAEHNGDTGSSAAQILDRMTEPPAIVDLVSVFRLTDFERDVLLLCAGTELDSSFVERCTGNPAGVATFGLALEHLAGAHWSALSTGGALRHWRMVEVREAGALTSSPLRIDERVLNHLLGLDHRDDLLAGIVCDPPGQLTLTPSHARVAERIRSHWSFEAESGRAPIVRICGTEQRVLVDVATAASQLAGFVLCIAPAGGLPKPSAELEGFCRIWEREAALSKAVLLIDETAHHESDRETRAAVDRVVNNVDSFVIVASTERRNPNYLRSTITIDVEPLTQAEQQQHWRECADLEAADFDEQFAALTSQFDLGPTAIESACRQAAAETNGGLTALSPTELSELLWSTCRSQARSGMDSLARRLDSLARWDDLVVSDEARGVLESVVRHVRHRARVLGDWGFATAGRRGQGISVLFAGPSGTGKTMAAEVLATELELDLFSIDLSSLVSKYIGETEKNLRQVFDAAETSGAILLFDEADALFGKRSEVRDSHDRHANIEVSYLLQRVESYRGVAILTSNMREAIDGAFLRRLSFIVDFPFPGANLREQLWRRAFPANTPTRGLDPVRLAQLHASGGSIRNIALSAAFLAADSDEPVGMHHVRAAAIMDFAKAERRITPSELQGWP